MYKRSFWIVLILLLLGGGIWWLNAAPPAASQPNITWSPSTIYASITATTSVTKTFTFATNQTAQNVTLEAVPEIAGFIQIQPSTFAQVPATQPQAVTIRFSAPAGAKFGAFDGTIHLRIGTATIPQTLKVSVTFAVVPLPPDPGAAGKATLAGIDSDRDGVRDDVERYIAFTYPGSEKVRSALNQYAKSAQGAVLNGTDPQGSVTAMRSTLRAQHCSNYTEWLLHIPGTDYLYKHVLIQLLNTSDRARAFYNADANSSGHFFGTPSSGHEIEECDVNPGSLLN